jgi:hypothetical protein
LILWGVLFYMLLFAGLLFFYYTALPCFALPIQVRRDQFHIQFYIFIAFLFSFFAICFIRKLRILLEKYVQ